MLRKRSLLSLVLVAAFSSVSWAADMSAECTTETHTHSITGGTTHVVTAETTRPITNGTRWITGGIGATEAEAMRLAAPDYSLAMTFAAQTGQFVSDVDVAVKHLDQDLVLWAEDADPILLADLPPGRYQIDATYQGRTLTRNVTVGSVRTTRAVFQWQVAGLQPELDSTRFFPAERVRYVPVERVRLVPVERP
jgi:hypothetical protein